MKFRYQEYISVIIYEHFKRKRKISDSVNNKKPYTHRKIQKQRDNTKTPPNISIS